MAHRVSPRAGTDLDEIWYYTATESGSVEIANRLIDTLTDRFFMLAGFPHAGRSRDDKFGPGCRSVAVGEYVIVYYVENVDVRFFASSMAAATSRLFSTNEAHPVVRGFSKH